mgnify:CR=1 FL=1
MFIGKKPTDAPLTSSDVADGIITNAKLAQDIISADTALGAEPADTDEFLVSDAGTLKRMDYSYIKASGITVADNWRLNANDTVDSSETDLDTGWERVDTTGQGTLGSAMTQSSGIFTFPSTGIYFIRFQIYYVGNTADYGRAIIKHYDGSSTYTIISDVRTDIQSSKQEVITTSTLFDCQNTSTDKCRFDAGGNENDAVIAGSTTDNRTSAIFIRLGDT